MGERRAGVLIVDDECFFREAIREILEGEGFRCAECSDGKTAVDLARDSDLGVVILGVRLPDMDGIEVLRQLREQRASLQVIMLSASTDQDLVLEALRLGACDYLAKPLHDEELVFAVRRAAGSHAVTADWQGLQSRLHCLADRIEGLSSTLVGRGGDERSELVREGAVDVAAEVLGAGKTSLMLLSRDGTELRVAAVHGRALSPADMDPVRLGEGVAGRALERIEATCVADVGADPRFAARGADERYDSTSFAVAPLALGQRRFGVLCATDRAGGGDFVDEDLCLLRLLAMQISELLAAESSSELEAHESLGAVVGPATDVEFDADGETMLGLRASAGASDLDAELARLICDAMVSEVEPQRVIRAVLGPLARNLRADPVALFLIDNETGTLRLEGQSDACLRSERAEFAPGRGLCGLVAKTGHLVASDEPAADPRYEAAIDTPADGLSGPLLCVPLQLRGKVIGVFRAFLQDRGALSARTGEVLSAALSAAVRNVLLYRSLVESIEEVAAARRDAQRGPSAH